MGVRLILLISNHSLFREVLHRLLADLPDVEVIEATSWEAGLAVSEDRPPGVIVVDHEDLRLRDSDLAPLLEPAEKALRVIYLTLAGNEMIVHERRRVTNVTEAALLRALQVDP